MIEHIGASIAAGIGYFAGAMVNTWLQRRKLIPQIDDLNAANTDLSDRLSVVTGQLAEANRRYDLRVKRAQDGAKAGVKTKKEKREKEGEPMRIKLPEVVTP